MKHEASLWRVVRTNLKWKFVKTLLSVANAIVWFHPAFQGRTSTEENTQIRTIHLFTMCWIGSNAISNRRRYALLNVYYVFKHAKRQNREAEVFSHLCKFLAEEINARTDLSREWDISNQFFVFECVRLASGQSRIGSVRWAAPTYGYNHNHTLSSIYCTIFSVDKQKMFTVQHSNENSVPNDCVSVSCVCTGLALTLSFRQRSIQCDR